MVTFAAPAFLAAGALLALAPLVLHMLARTPPERRPLPTARFLEPDPRTRLRLRRPADPLLLALRVVFLLLLGAAFAGPAWTPQREGGGAIVLLDAGAGMAPAWDEAIARAADRLRGGGALVVFDTAARVVDDGAGALDSIGAAGPSDAPSSYLAALRGLRLAGGALRMDTAAAVLITRPRWDAWSPAVPVAREAAWPARIELVPVGAEPATAPALGPVRPIGSPGRAAVLGPAAHPLRHYATAALAALGYEVGAVADADETDLVLVLRPDEDPPASSPAGVRRVVFLGGRPERDGAGPLRSRGRLVFPAGRALDGWRPIGGLPVEADRVVAVWEDGRAAAGAAMTDDGCRAYLAAEPVADEAAADPGFPHLIEALADGCTAAVPRPEAPGAVALDAGAMAVLSRDTLPRSADLSALARDGGRPLARILLLLAAVVAMAEAALAYGRKGAR